jgi:hypothetical protein
MPAGDGIPDHFFDGIPDEPMLRRDWRIAVNCATGGFETSGLRLDTFGQPLTNSWNRRLRRSCGSMPSRFLWSAGLNRLAMYPAHALFASTNARTSGPRFSGGVAG